LVIVSTGAQPDDRLPRAVFFDAAGTLFEVRGSVGEVYASALEKHSIKIDAHEIEARFRKTFSLQPPLAFSPELDDVRRRVLERNWWRDLVVRVVAPDGTFPSFDDFFDELFEHFRTGDAWRVFQDTRPALDRLRRDGYKLGIISNFDSRLDDVLSALGLNEYFTSVVISSRAGFAKPDPRIFVAAAESVGLESSECVHIGDSLHEDFEGAQSSGMIACLLDRNARLTPNAKKSVLHLED